MNLFTALTPVYGLAINVFSQFAWRHLSRNGSLLRSIYAGFIAGGLVVFVLQFATGRASAGDVVTYGMLSYSYFHFINLGVTGRRVRLMRELHAAPEGLTLQELYSRYNAKHIVAMRLGRMLNSGQIVLADGRYRLGRPTLAWMAGAILFAKKAILGRSSEFDAKR